MSLFGKHSKRAEVRKAQEERFQKFREELKEEPLEKGDFTAMVLGAFLALWPMLLVVIGIILVVAFFFLR